MATPILNNNIKYPYGLPYLTRGNLAVVLSKYSQYHTYGPSAVTLGPSLTFTVTGSPGAPANHALVTVTAPNGAVFIFEFLYPAAVASAGNIGVPLATGAGSTAAQVATAFLAILNAGTVTPVGGSAEKLPWNMTQTGAAQLRINFNVAGPDGQLEGPEGIATDSQTDQAFATNPVVPARFGKCYAFLPGA